MLYFEWSLLLAGSWSSKNEPTELGVTIKNKEATLNLGVKVAVAIPQELVNPEGEFSINPEGEFLPWCIKSDILESNLAKL